MFNFILPIAALALSYVAFFREADAKEIPANSGRMGKLYSKYGQLLETESKRLGITVSTCAAVLAVESSGNPFGSDGRLIIRFEDHVFRDRSGDKSFYASNGNQSNEYEVLELARQINENAAFESISMGMAQIMGFNYKLVGFDSAKEMFESFQYSDINQVIAFFRFIEFYKGGKLLTAAQTDDFSTFATYYNGPAHKNYDTKMISAKKEFISKLGFE